MCCFSYKWKFRLKKWTSIPGLFQCDRMENTIRKTIKLRQIKMNQLIGYENSFSSLLFGFNSFVMAAIRLWEKPVSATLEFLKSVNTILFDLDGVLWAGEKLLPGAASFLSQCEESNVKTIFITNNSTKSRDTVVKKFKDFGILVEKRNVYTSSYAAAAYLSAQNFNKKAFVVGGQGIHDELSLCGIESLKDEGSYTGQLPEIFSSPLDSDVGAVVVGLDINFNYKKLALAELYIKNGAQFIGTNGDVNYPYARGAGEPKVLLPGGGVMVGALETCTKTKAKIMGKPTPYFFELIQREHNITPSSTIFMGDNLLTDILFGNGLGIRTVFVLSGVSRLEEVETLGVTPTYIAEGVEWFVKGEEKGE